MSRNNIRSIPRQRIQYKGLAKLYPLTKRSHTTLSPDNLEPEVSNYYPPATDTGIHVLSTLEKPHPNSVLFAEFNTTELNFHNNLLAYRMLKLLYGPPEVLACPYIAETDTAIPLGREWGYLLKIDERMLAEVRSVLSNARLVIRFWLDHEPEENEREIMAQKASKFLGDYEESINKNAHLFVEDQDVPKDRLSAAPAIMNVFAQNYRAAEALLKLAESEESPTVERYVAWDHQDDVNTYGSLYVSSAIQFFSALEALINTVFTLTLKDEFRADHYERMTVRADLDVRLMTAHLFCNGFERQIVAPKTDVWIRLLKLRDFRNAVVHGNITPEHYLYALIEDDNLFYYNPSFDFRGRRREAEDSEKYPTTMSAVRSGTVNEIKKTVDFVVSELLDASDDFTKQWLSSWLWKPLISPDVQKLVQKI